MKKLLFKNGVLAHPAQVFSLLLSVMLILDQLVKAIQRSTMQVGDSIPLIKGVFHLTSALNTGAAFSFLEGKRSFFLIVSTLVILVLFIYLAIEKPRRFYPLVGLALLIAGSIGNFIDRLIFGHVFDIFDFRLINFAIFNVADIGITFGVIFLFIWILFFDFNQSKAELAAPDPSDFVDLV